MWSKTNKIKQQLQNGKPHFYGFEGKSLNIPGMTPLTVLLSEIAYILVDHDGENPVAWLKSTKRWPGENLH